MTSERHLRILGASLSTRGQVREPGNGARLRVGGRGRDARSRDAWQLEPLEVNLRRQKVEESTRGDARAARLPRARSETGPRQGTKVHPPEVLPRERPAGRADRGTDALLSGGGRSHPSLRHPETRRGASSSRRRRTLLPRSFPSTAPALATPLRQPSPPRRARPATTMVFLSSQWSN